VWRLVDKPRSIAVLRRVREPAGRRATAERAGQERPRQTSQRSQQVSSVQHLARRPAAALDTLRYTGDYDVVFMISCSGVVA